MSGWQTDSVFGTTGRLTLLYQQLQEPIHVKWTSGALLLRLSPSKIQ